MHQTRARIGGFLAAVAAAIFVAVLLLRDQPEVRKAAATPASMPAELREAGAPPLLVGGPNSAVAVAEVQATPASTPSDRRSPSPLPTPEPEETLTPEESSLGQIHVGGIVSDESGQPLEGTSVVLKSVRWNFRRPGTGSSGATSSVLTELGRTATGPTGFFLIPITMKMPVQVEATADGYAPAVAMLRSGRLRIERTEEGIRFVRADLVLAEGITFCGRVVDQHGEPVADATATAYLRAAQGVSWDGKHFELTTSTDSKGRFCLSGARAPDGTLLRLSKEGYATVQYQVENLDEEKEWLLSFEGGRIEGIVLREGSEQPVAGARVVAYEKKGGVSLNVDPISLSTKSRSDGAFVLGPLHPSNWLVVAEDLKSDVRGIPGSAAAEVALGELAQIEGLKLELPAGLRVVGRVLDAETKEPIAGAELREGWMARDEVLMATTDGDGIYTFDPVALTLAQYGENRLQIRAHKEGYKPMEPVEDYEVGPDGTVYETIELDPIEWVLVAGRVVNNEGVAAANVVVKATGSERALTNREGQFTLKTARSAVINLEASPPSGPITYHPPIEYEGRDLRDILIELDPGGRLEVLVRDPEGAPLQGARVYMMRRTYSEWGGSASHFDSAVTGSDGIMRSRVDWPSTGAQLESAVDSASLDVSVEHPDFDSPEEQKNVSIPPGERRQLTFTMLEADRSAYVDGFVLTEDGEPIEGARVWFARGEPGEAQTDALGFFRIEGLRAGPYLIAVRHPSYSFTSQEEDLPVTGLEFRATQQD